MRKWWPPSNFVLWAKNFHTVREKSWNFWRKVHDSVFKPANYMSHEQENKLGKLFRKLTFLKKILAAGCAKTAFGVSWGLFWVTFWEMMFFLKILCLERTFSVFWRENLSTFSNKFTIGFSKLQFMEKICFQGNKLRIFFGKNYGFSIFFIVWPKMFGLWAEKFKQGCRNWLRRVRRNLLRKWKFVKKNGFIVVFVPWAENFGTVDKNFTTVSSKPPSTCPGKQFKSFCFKKWWY